jgi:hypothetical protein
VRTENIEVNGIGEGEEKFKPQSDHESEERDDDQEKHDKGLSSTACSDLAILPIPLRNC